MIFKKIVFEAILSAWKFYVENDVQKHTWQTSFSKAFKEIVAYKLSIRQILHRPKYKKMEFSSTQKVLKS